MWSHWGGCCTLVVVEETPPPFNVKHFEYPEKHSINVTNYYYYLYCQWSPLLIQYAQSVRLEAALHNTPQKLDWQQRADIGHWFIFTLGLHFIYFFSNSHWQFPTNSNRHVWQVSLNHCIALLSVLVFAVWIFWSLFVRPWNVWEVTYCNLVTICIGLGLSMQCKLAFKGDTSENTLKW